MTDLTLKECRTQSDQILFRDLVNQYHSYVKHVRTPNRRIHWLVYHKTDLIGAIGINSCTLNLGPRDALLGVRDNADRLRCLPNLANNYRFCLIRDKCPPNAASQVLKLMREEAPRVWRRKYGNRLNGIETFVGNGLKGSCYLADNWRYLGDTQGWSMQRLPRKLMQKKRYASYLLAQGRQVLATRTEPKKIFFTGLGDYRSRFLPQPAPAAPRVSFNDLLRPLKLDSAPQPS